MTNFSRISLAALFSLSLGSLALADDPAIPLPRPTFAAGVAAPGYAGFGFGHLGGAASTAHESILRGRADVIRANGEHALMTAEALRSLEEAKSRFLDNEAKRLAVRQERKRMGIAERAHRYDFVQSRRETQMALNRAAREIQTIAVPETVQYETQAQSKLQLAKSLLNNGNFESGIARLQEIAQHHAQTAAAQEAASILAELRG